MAKGGMRGVDSDIHTPLMIIGSVVAMMLLLGFLQQSLKRKAKKCKNRPFRMMDGTVIQQQLVLELTPSHFC